MKKLFLLLLSIQLFFAGYSQYQEHYLVSCSGDYFANSEISVSWSLGEIATETFYGTNYIVTQGFQQLFNAVVGIDKKQSNLTPSVLIYPNPTNSIIKINFRSTNNNSHIPNYYQVYNSSGELLTSNEISCFETKINIQPYQSGIYLLKLIYNNSKYNQTHKIQKLN